MTALNSAEILLVEDNYADVILIQEAFKRVAHKSNLRVVDNGQAAMEYLRKEGNYASAARPDLVLTDINMPKMDGIELLKAVKGDQSLSSIPVAILTSSKAEADIDACYQSYCSGYFVKPNELEDLYHIIRSLEQYWFSENQLLNK